jgi:hypothetical protein
MLMEIEMLCQKFLFGFIEPKIYSFSTLTVSIFKDSIFVRFNCESKLFTNGNFATGNDWGLTNGKNLLT